MLRLWYANCKKHGHPVLDPGNSSKTGSCRCLFTTITLRTIARVIPNCADLIRHRTGRATTRRILPAMSKPKDSTARFSKPKRDFRQWPHSTWTNEEKNEALIEKYGKYAGPLLLPVK